MMKYLVLLICSCFMLHAQTTQQLSNVSSIQWVSSVPSGPNQVSASVHGIKGSNVFYYWVIAKFTGGDAPPSNVAMAVNAPTTLSGSNYVTVSWSNVAGASGYDVIKNNYPSYPSSGSIALVKNTQNLSVNDTGQALSAYTPNTFNPVTCSWYIDNTSGSTPSIVTPCLPSGNSGIQPTGGTNYVPFVTSGTSTRAAVNTDILGLLGAPYNSV